MFPACAIGRNATASATREKSDHDHVFEGCPRGSRPGCVRCDGVAAGISDAHSASAQGRASWYGSAHHGRKTANGERFNMNAMTAAHKTLPFGTKVRVTNVRNGRSVVVRINDRGPYVHGRVIDVSKAAAGRLGLIASGTAPVRLQILN